jgi:hypothetical protein
MELIRLNIKHYRDHTVLGHLYTQLMVLINVLSCFQYIYLTYTSIDTNNKADLYYAVFYLELCAACLFVFDFVLSILSADNLLYFFGTFHCWVDLMTFIPVFATYNVTCPSFNEIGSPKACVYFVVCGLTTTRILRSLRFHKYFLAIEDEVQRYLADMGLKIVVMILFSKSLICAAYFDALGCLTCVSFSSSLQTRRWCSTWSRSRACPSTHVSTADTESEPKPVRNVVFLTHVLSPPAGMYYMLVTIATVGYGDITPQTAMGRFAAMGMIIVAIIIVPSYEMMQILRDPAFSSTVTYLEGNALNEKDLKRAKAISAKAIFIMTNKFSADPDEEDAKTILQQFSIQRFLRLHSDHSNVESLFCLQLIRPENKRHLVTSADSLSTDLVICLNEFKMGVIAKAVIFPGANTLIMNLLTSFADDKEQAPARTQDGIETLDDDEDSDWLGEYQRGCDWEIYTTELSSVFEGSTFCALSEILYQKLGIVLFALEVEDLQKEKSSTRLLLNPADFVIPPKADYRIDAFVMAKNKAQSDLTFTRNNSDSILGSGINFSHLSLLATGIAQRMTINHSAHAKVHHGGHEESKDSPAPGERAEVKDKQAWQQLLRKHEAEKVNCPQ